MKMNSDFITIEYLQFLDALRLSGKTNMFYSVQNLRQKFPYLTEDMGRNILVHWFQTFRQRAKEKVQRESAMVEKLRFAPLTRVSTGNAE